ncbi:MAG: hypothetical protein HY954_09445 [Deltaproteobacteria bacterium]|nr:hypothetical protein [Deltaproteobacteria bacterium]
MIKLFSILSAVMLLSFSIPGAARSEGTDTVRLKLLNSPAINTLYSIDDHFTIVSGKDKAAVTDALRAICSDNSGTVAAENDGTIKCGAVFEAERLERTEAAAGSSNERFFLIKNNIPQPFVYRNSSIPSYDELSAPPNGQISGKYNIIDLFQYMSALCKKDNGKPAIVVSKRYGRFVRLTQVGAVEGFNYFLSSGEEKEPWYFACEGKQKFIVEKDYKYSSEEDNKLFFYQNRGLEGIDFVKGNDIGSMAGLIQETIPVNETVEKEFLNEMALEISNLKLDFVKTSAGSRYSGFYKGDKEGCGLVTIKHQNFGKEELVRVFTYEVCSNNVAAVTDNTAFASLLKYIFSL